MAILVKFGAEIKEFQKQMKKLTKEVETVGKTFTDIGKGLTTGLTLPLAGVGVASVKTAADFESAMSEVKAISGATGTEFEALEATAKRLGETTAFSASEAAAGMKYLAMAGWDTEAMMEAMPGLLDLAAASGTDLAITADIVSDAMTAFGMKASEATKFADLMASVSKNANTNVEMLGESFKYAAPVAAALGYSVEDTAEWLGLMANSGIKASQAGTTLRGALTRMADPAEESAKMIKDLGISITNADGSMKSMDELAANLRSSFSGLNESQRAQAASTIFGKEAMSGMLAVISATESDITKLSEATTNYQGVASEMADTMLDNLSGKFTLLKSALEGAAISIGTALIPMIESLVEGITGLSTWFNNLSAEQQGTIIKIAGLVAAIGPMLMIIGKTISIVGKLKAGFVLLSTVGFAPIITTIAVVVGAIMALAGVFIYLWNTNEDFRTNVMALWNQLKEFFSALIGALTFAFQTFAAFLEVLWTNNTGNIRGIIETGWTFIVSIINVTLEIILGLFDVFTKLLSGDWEGAWTALKDLLKVAIEGIVQIITDGLNFVLNIFGTNLDEAWKVVTAWKDNVLSVFTSLKDGIIGTFNKISDFVKNFKLPSFSLEMGSTSVMGKEIRFPKGFKVNWHADGGIFTRPTILGGHGFGEAGKEAILPLNKLPGLLGLDRATGNTVQVYLDGRMIYEHVDKGLGRRVQMAGGYHV